MDIFYLTNRLPVYNLAKTMNSARRLAPVQFFRMQSLQIVGKQWAERWRFLISELDCEQVRGRTSWEWLQATCEREHRGGNRPVR